MAWYKKLFGMQEEAREVSTGIEIGPGIQLMSGDQIEHPKQEEPAAPSQPIMSMNEAISLQEQLNALSQEILLLRKEREQERASALNGHIRLLRASAYPSIESVVEALIEAQEGRPERLKEITEKRAQVRALYPKI